MGVVGLVLSLGLASWLTNAVFYRILMGANWAEIKIEA